MKTKMHRFIAFDIGFRNFAFSVIDVEQETWNVIYIENKDLLGNNSMNNVSTEFWQSFQLYLYSIGHVFESVEVALIEKQMGYRGKTNYKAIQMASQLMAHLLLVHPTIMVMEYASTQKTKLFGSSLSTWKDRKNWSVNFVHTLLEEQGDEIVQGWLSQFSKQDDICDTILMILAYNMEKKKIFIDRKI